MSATNKTTYYDLPIFIGTDVPSWLGDWNNTMNALDGAINGVKNAADNATNVANTAEGKSDANTETINALTAEVNTIKQAVQNYDSILDFKQVPVVLNPNNVTDEASFFMVQNTNKTLNKLSVGLWLTDLTNPTTYNYTGANGTYTWYDIATVEDNCLNLNQGSLPNDNICLTPGILTMISLSTTKTIAGCNYLRAWYDGATTHFGFTSNSTVNNLKGLYLIGDFTVFLSGTVYSPDDPSTD